MSAAARHIRRFGTGFTGAALRGRLSAAALHLLLSAVVSGLLSVSLIGLLYPSPYFHAAGGKALLIVIILVDIVVGPLLTLMIFDRRKPGLRRDLTVIAMLQIAALVYGLYATAMSRPVFQTFVRDRFELVSAAEVDPEELAKAPVQFQRMSWSSPMTAAARRPDDPAMRDLLLFSSSYGVDARHMLRFYVDYESQRDEVLAKARRIDELEHYNPKERIASTLQAVLKPGADSNDVRYLPLSAKREDLTVLIDAHSAAVIAVVRLQPW